MRGIVRDPSKDDEEEKEKEKRKRRRRRWRMRMMYRRSKRFGRRIRTGIENARGRSRRRGGKGR